MKLLDKIKNFFVKYWNKIFKTKNNTIDAKTFIVEPSNPPKPTVAIIEPSDPPKPTNATAQDSNIVEPSNPPKP